MHTIIAFDISDDRTRYRAGRLLLDHARRVQKSVFETPLLDTKDYLRLRSDLEGIINDETDSLRYYRLCRTCAVRIEFAGAGPERLLLPESFSIIT